MSTLPCKYMRQDDESYAVLWSRDNDLQALSQAVDALERDVAKLGNMSPLDHLGWAEQLPLLSERHDAPPVLQEAAEFSRECGPQRLQNKRHAAVTFWEKRRRELQPEWDTIYDKLPAHVRSVLGRGKNLLLLQANAPRELLQHYALHAARQELLNAANHPDAQLVNDLMQGFRLTGRVQMGHNTPPIQREGELSPRTLRRDKQYWNDAILRRVHQTKWPDKEIAEIFEKKADEEVAAGKAAWRHIDDTVGAAVLTPRFAKDEGHKVKPDGSLMRAVRCLDDFSASWVNSAAWASECMRLNTLDTLVSLARLAAHGAHSFDFLGRSYKILEAT